VNGLPPSQQLAASKNCGVATNWISAVAVPQIDRFSFSGAKYCEKKDLRSKIKLKPTLVESKRIQLIQIDLARFCASAATLSKIKF